MTKLHKIYALATSTADALGYRGQKAVAEAAEGNDYRIGAGTWSVCCCMFIPPQRRSPDQRRMPLLPSADHAPAIEYAIEHKASPVLSIVKSPPFLTAGSLSS